MKKVAGFLAGSLVVLFLIVALPVFFVAGGPSAGACTLDPADVDELGDVAGYQGEQLENAAAIMNVAAALGLGVRGQQIGVMTAMEESTLQNLTYGDGAINPNGTVADSVGLFQQQGTWGSLQERLDPSTAARLFFERLMQVEGWESMPPEEAAYTVQINIGAYLYAEHWDEAVEVVHELTSIAHCSTAAVSSGGGAMPSTAPVTSDYGYRGDPATGYQKFHHGIDFSGGCGNPIYAAAGGTVSRIFQEGYGAWTIELDHGNGEVSWYVHMYGTGIFVEEGQQVAAGQQIAEEGNTGYSTGCHLHFEVQVNGVQVDPWAWLAARGVAVPAGHGGTP